MAKATTGCEVKAAAESIYAAMQAKGGLKDVYCVACGGSLSAFYSVYYLLRNEAKSFDVAYMTANEFVHATPVRVNENALVITISMSGTPETVEAAKKAKELGATTISLAVSDDSPLFQYGDYNWIYNGRYFDFYYDLCSGSEALTLRLGFELLRLADNYENYDAAIDGFDKLNDMALRIMFRTRERAKKFGEAYKDDKMIYVLGSGANLGHAYSETICIFNEMVWVDAFCFNSGELFHGPFECCDQDQAYLVFVSEGRTRFMDLRALNFLRQHSEHVSVIDARELGVSQIAHEVEEYFSGLITGVAAGNYTAAIEFAKNHPNAERRYMHHFAY